MSPQRHARQIFDTIAKQGVAKYLRGQREHGGQLWKVPALSLIEFAQEEVIDQGSYLWTLPRQIKQVIKLLNQLAKEAPEHSERINQILNILR